MQPFSNDEYNQRLANTRQNMAELNLRVFLTHSPENIYYLTGYQTPGYYKYQTLIIPERGEPILLIRLDEESNGLAAPRVQTLITYRDTQDPVRMTCETIANAGWTRGPFGVEEDCWFLPVSQYKRLSDLLDINVELVDASGLVESLRVVKSPAEVDYIRQAATVANGGMRAGIEAIAMGRTENDIASAIHTAIIAAGGEYMSLPIFISSGPRSYLTHATWDGRQLERNDLIPIELSACVKRYSAALYRTVYLGSNPSDQVRRMDEATSAALNAVIDSIRPGVSPDEIARIEAETYMKYGFDQKKRTGYSMGINFPPDWGEGHALSLQQGEHRVLEPGMVFHVPCAVRIYGEAITGTSETVLVTSRGREVLTKYMPRGLVTRA